MRDQAAKDALTPADYVGEAAFAREQRLFARGWTPICRTNELPTG